MNKLKKLIQKTEDWLQGQVSSQSLIAFRILFGLFVILDGFYYYARVPQLFAARGVYISYPGFEFWPRLSVPEMRVAVIALMLGGALLSLGLATRWVCAALTVLTANLLLFDASYYMNHLALLIVAELVFVLVPWVPWGGPLNARAKTVPRWAIGLAQTPFLGAYFFGGISKLRADWFSGAIFRDNMISRHSESFLARIFSEGAPLWLGTWSGLLLDLLALPLLAFKKTRLPFLGVLLLFHGLNHVLLNIGLFSILMVFSLTLYLPPDWPSKAWKALRAQRPPEGRATHLLPALIALLGVVSLQQLWSERGSVPWNTATRFFSWLPDRGTPSACSVRFHFEPMGTKPSTGPAVSKDSDLLGLPWRGKRGHTPALVRRHALENLCGSHGGQVYADMRCEYRRSRGSTEVAYVPMINPRTNLCAP